MKKTLITLLLLTCYGCANFSTLQSARTTPKGTTEIVGGLGAGISFNEDGALTAIPQVLVRHGVTPSLDVSIGTYAIAGAQLETKYMFYSDDLLAFAGGLKIMHAFPNKMTSLVLPFYGSVEMEHVTLYLSPKIAFTWTKYYREYLRGTSRAQAANYQDPGPLYLSSGGSIGAKIPITKQFGVLGEGTLMVGTLSVLEAAGGLFFNF